MIVLTRITLVLVALACTPACATAQEPGLPASGINRLMSLARVWGEAKYFHPGLAEPAISWDSIGAAAIRVAQRARTSQEFAAAVNGMLAALRDPTTRVVSLPFSSVNSSAEGAAPSSASRTSIRASARWTADGGTVDSVLVVTVGSDIGGLAEDSARRQLAALSEQANRARRVIVDLRGTRATTSSTLSHLFEKASLDRALLDRSLCGVAARRRTYVAFPAPGLIAPSQFSGWRQRDAPCFRAGSTVPKQGVVFLVDSESAVPTIAPSMQAAGVATIVGVGPVTDAATVELDTIALAPGFGVQMRLAARHTCSSVGRLADTVVTAASPAENERALDVARMLTRQRPAARQCPAIGEQAVIDPAADVADTILPAPEWRVLGAFQIYSAIRFFDPHVDLIEGHNWDSVVATNLPAIQRAATRHEYLATISRLLAALNDGHATFPPMRLLALYGWAFPPLIVRLVEGRLVVTENFDSSAAPGVHRGDIVVDVDDEDAQARFAAVRQYLPGSTPESRDANSANFVFAGPEGSVLQLVILDARGHRETVTVPRRVAYLSKIFNPGRDPALRLFPGNVGYADLSLLPLSAVDSMFERFGRTGALILDLRGYPQGTHPLIASRLAQGEAVAARIRTPIVDAPRQLPTVLPKWITGLAESHLSFEEATQRVIPDGRPPYAGHVYVLVDERSISQSEQAALFYKAAAQAILVGNNTAGADGTVTIFTVAGDVGVGFTSVDVRAPDGARIQGAGLSPDVHVRPTVAGIRAGQDEVLDCALRLATKQARTCSRRNTSIPRPSVR